MCSAASEPFSTLFRAKADFLFPLIHTPLGIELETRKTFEARGKQFYLQCKI